MKKEHVKTYQTQFISSTPQEILAFFLKEFPDKITLASSLGMEDQVLTDMLCKLTQSPDVFVLDTGRLHQETYDILQLSMAKYGIAYRVFYPNTADVEAMVSQHGPNLFYDSVENRKHCCHIRKVEPLKRALDGYKVWITGQRRDQGITRTDLQPIEWDDTHQMIKLNPLAHWTLQETESYVSSQDIPVNFLHKHGYPSIGCTPCTRAIKPGEDLRAGRWWWENADQKECGLHGKGESR